MTVAVFFEDPLTGERTDFGNFSFWPTEEEARSKLLEVGCDLTNAHFVECK